MLRLAHHVCHLLVNWRLVAQQLLPPDLLNRLVNNLQFNHRKYPYVLLGFFQSKIKLHVEDVG